MLLHFRSIIFVIFMGITVFIYGGLIIALAPFCSSLFLSKIANKWGKLNLFLLRIICGLEIRIHGFDHLPNNSPYLVIAKHQSTWETIALRALLPPNQAWIIKKELLSYPIFGLALKFTGQIAIDRSSGKEALNQLLDQGINALSQGKLVIIFPEGTRTRFGTRGKYNIGAAILAEKSNALVVPVAHNAGLYWPCDSWIKYPGTIDLVIGKPIENMQNLRAKQINFIVTDWIETNVAHLPQCR
jgi:1-acyl-sn-glycerol-3-phosphate acyltransferase